MIYTLNGAVYKKKKAQNQGEKHFHQTRIVVTVHIGSEGGPPSVNSLIQYILLFQRIRCNMAKRERKEAKMMSVATVFFKTSFFDRTCIVRV